MSRRRTLANLSHWQRAGIVGGGLWVAAIGVSIAQDQPQPPPAKSEEPAEPEQKAPLTPLARQFLEAAKARLEAERQPKLEREQARRREEAQKLAIQTAREYAKQQATKEHEAQRQLQLARERQLKALYHKGLLLYQQGAYQEAIEMLQQMTLVAPGHPLVKAAERLITRAELKRFGQQARARAALLPEAKGAKVPDLERQLEAKRMELETILKFARAAIREHHYDSAIELLYRALAQDPSHHQAKQLLEQVQMAKLKDEETRLERQVLVDEQRMVNDVTRAELLNPEKTGKRATSPSPGGTPLEPSSELTSRLTEPISFDFQDVAFNDVLDFLADAANVSIIPSPRVDLKNLRVSLRVDQLPLELALKYLVKNTGLAYRLEEGVILIASPEEFESEPLETRVFFLRAGLGPFALETSAVEPSTVLEMDPLKTLIERAITQPPGSKLVIDERSGSLIITNTTENLRLIERLLSQLDIAPVQVLIEARFVEINLTELEQLGFEAVLTGPADLTKKTAGDTARTRGPGFQVAKSGGVKFPALSRESESLNLTLQGVLTGTQFESVLHLLEETKKSKTLSAPRITTLNNQAASIKVVDEFRYPTRYEVSLVQFDVNGDGDFDDAGETEFVNVPQDLQKRDVGILLNVTPSVGKDLRTITLVLAPEVSQFSQFRDLGGGVTVPQFTTSQLTTSVVIEDGQTVMLGGLMKDTISEQFTKVPVLGDLPLLGQLFRQREQSQTRKNLLIFITARVLAPRGPTI